MALAHYRQPRPRDIFRFDFDSIMCLLVGSLSEEEPLETDATARARAFGQAHRASSVQSCKRHVQELRRQNPRVGTVAKLSDVEDDEGAIRLDFEKTRLKTPANADQVQPVIMWPSDNWRVEAAAKAGAGRVREKTTVEIARAEFLNAYDRLADGIINSPGFDGAPVRKVKVEAIRDELKSVGFSHATKRETFRCRAEARFSRPKPIG